ncbi:tetratricopeptide repeat protein [Treponema phagedenis F0421]|uniref:tetratricopeptide repeat protein n=1 Tax=Treponema phagedenis TaxID=162 RepID=UPI0001F63DF3|nr:hypothetical protein [Treponema phagedenis]EFW38309.1 tetratricopeptide repeat protein [Treponema phagedenis F0421]
MAKKAQCFLAVLAVFSLSFYFSCKKTNPEEFHQKLEYIDSLIPKKENTRILKDLIKLSKKAKTPSEHLSIVKRQLSFKAIPDALQTLQSGMQKNPEDDSLPAVTISILLKEERFADAARYADYVKYGKYEALGAEASILADVEAKTQNTSPEFWKTAFKKTGFQVFLQNAAIMKAVQGKMKEAFILKDAVSPQGNLKNPYLWTLLAFDQGYFSTVFENLPLTLALADSSTASKQQIKNAKAHILLAADAAYGLNDKERAQAFWQQYIDYFPTQPMDALYNLALTAPTEKESVDALIHCIKINKTYYPATAQYIRAFAKLRNNAKQSDSITSFLENKGFYSLEMEKEYFLSPRFTILPEDLFKEILADKNADIRFHLEAFHYKYIAKKNLNGSSAAMWKLLEQFPQNQTIRNYARWFFMYTEDYGAAFSIEKTDFLPEDNFYAAVAKASRSENAEILLREFAAAMEGANTKKAAIINTAIVFDAMGESDSAVENFIRAAEIAQSSEEKSRLQYRAAEILAKKRLINRAIEMLHHSLELDPKNYSASVLLEKLKAAQ